MRFAQGIGASAGPLVARSIVRDLYAREQAAHLLARMMAVFGIGAAVSAGLAAAFDGTTRPMAVAIGLFGFLAFISEKYSFRKASHG